jgi:hypothetical protein
MFSKKRSLDDFDEEGYEIDNSPPDEEIFKTSPAIKIKSLLKGLKPDYVLIPSIEFRSYKINRLGYL